jgi:predicted neutral ceramidase superfamily lipid hydrolase
MTDTEQATSAPAPMGDRIVFGLRQAALLGVALLIAGLVTERLRPDAVLDRGLASTPFLVAIVVWFVVLLLHAVAFDQSQMRSLEAKPLYAAAFIGAFVFLTGVISLDSGQAGRRFIYVFANSVGAIMFWWGVISMGYLLTRLFDDERLVGAS